MLRSVLVLAFCLLGLASQSQTTVRGMVVDEKGDPIYTANVYLENSYDGASTDEGGKFSFTTSLSGRQTLKVSFLGYTDHSEELDLDGEVPELRIALKRESTEVDRVVITAGAFEASDENKAVMLRPLDIVTTAGADGDLFGALETLPGTQTVGETEGLFVRGGTGEETVTVIDETIVQDPYFSSVPNIPQRGRFSPFSFKGTVFSTGGYSVQYGQALSAAVILESQDLATSTSSNLGILPVGISAGHTQAWEKTSLSGYLSYTNLTLYDRLFPTRTNWVKIPEVTSGTVVFRQKTGKTGLLKMYSSMTNNVLALDFPDLNNPGSAIRFQNRNRNLYVNSSWQDNLGEKLILFLGSSFSHDRDSGSFSGFRYLTSDNWAQFKAMITRPMEGGSALRLGAEVHAREGIAGYASAGRSPDELYQAGFAEMDFFLTPKLAARGGLRYEHSGLLDRSNLAPRVSIALKTGDHSQVSVAAGQFYQTPTPVRGDPAFDYFGQASSLKFEQATHFIANYQIITDKRTFRIEAYRKNYNNLLKYNLAAPVLATSTGDGYAQGLDIFWRDKGTLPLLDYWISYSYLDTRRNFRSFPTEAVPTFAAPHNVSVVSKYWIGAIRTSLSATYVYSSPRTYFNPNNPKFLDDLTPAYHNLSLSGSYLTDIFGNFTVVWFSIGNLLNIDNIYGYQYSSDGSVRIPTNSPQRRSVFAGMFISFNHTNE